MTRTTVRRSSAAIPTSDQTYGSECRRTGPREGHMAVDLVIDVENTPGALAQVATAISDAGVNIAAATCLGAGDRAELHILVKHARSEERRVGKAGRSQGW